MKLVNIPGMVDVERITQVILARLLRPCLAVGTGEFNGGQRSDLIAIYNRQCCEPCVHESLSEVLLDRAKENHHRVCQEHGLDPQLTAGMSTAANVRCLGLGRRIHGESEIMVLATAGVEGNAGRAGDPATVMETDGVFTAIGQTEPARIGTINLMVFFSHELTPSALMASLMTATEAKAIVLDDLVVGSRYSQGRATGTGTDQYVAVCPIDSGKTALTSVGKHVLLGQLLAEAVQEAIRAALEAQNSMTPVSRRRVRTQLQRYGFNPAELVRCAYARLESSDAALLEANLLSIEADPVVVAAVAGLAACLDQVRSGVLPKTCVSEIVNLYGRMIASAVSGTEVPEGVFEPLAAESAMDTVYAALAVGFSQKWAALHAWAAEVTGTDRSRQIPR